MHHMTFPGLFYGLQSPHNDVCVCVFAEDSSKVIIGIVGLSSCNYLFMDRHVIL